MNLQFGAEKSDSFSRQDIALLIVQTLERSLQLHLPKGAPIITWERGEPFSRQVDAHYGELFGALASRRWISGRYAAPELGLCQDTIITMNYDCFIDDSLLRLDVRPDYGFEKVFHDGEVKTPARSISLLKLHGSANWFLCTNESCQRKGVQVWEGGPARRLDYFHENTPCRGCSRVVEPLIVPPTWAKPGHSEVLAPVWRRALQALREAERIFIIGYSMPDTDAFFKYMLSLALGGNHRIQQVVCVNKSKEAFEKYTNLFQENFQKRRLDLREAATRKFVHNGDLARILGQYGEGSREGLDTEMIRASGFTVSG